MGVISVTQRLRNVALRMSSSPVLLAALAIFAFLLEQENM